MTALFPRWSNTAAKLALLGLLVVIAGIPIGLMVLMRTPYITGALVPKDQPVEFDHRHHVRDDGIDCLYCHNTADKSATAGIPTTELCMGCHSQIWNQSPMLEPVRRSYFSGESIPWNRVYNVPDFVYFNHAIHVNGGIGCVYCHGRVDMMARVYQVPPLTMGWCIDCHRAPQEVLKPRLGQGLGPPSLWGDASKMARYWNDDKYAVTRLTTCSACHR